MSRLFNRLKEIRLPRTKVTWPVRVITILLVATTIFLLAGFVYDIVNHSSIIWITPSATQFFDYQGMSDQTATASLLFIFLLAVGVSGGYVVFLSSRRAYHPREARMLLLIGLTMMIVPTIVCEVILRQKGL